MSLLNFQKKDQLAPVAQRLALPSRNADAPGSIPIIGSNFFNFLLQTGESACLRKTVQNFVKTIVLA